MTQNKCRESEKHPVRQDAGASKFNKQKKVLNAFHAYLTNIEAFLHFDAGCYQLWWQQEQQDALSRT